MKKPKISDTDLLLNADGSIYHLHLLPEELADTVSIRGIVEIRIRYNAKRSPYAAV